MAGDAVDVIVRFAGSIIDVRRIEPHQRYVIGTAAGVDLPLDLAPLTQFPLVDVGLVVRVPTGVEAIGDGRRTKLVIGLVAITIVRVTGQPIRVPRPRASRRIVPYALITLVLQVALVAVALATAEPDPVTIPVVQATPPRHVPTRLLPTPRPKPTKAARAAKQAVARASEPAAALTPEQAREAGRSGGFLGAASLDDLSALLGTADLAAELAGVGPIYDEHAANAQGFGNSAGKFDPANDPAFDSVKTGGYVTNQGNMGQHYRLPAHGKFREVDRPPIMGLTCDDALCQTVGSLDRFAVRDHVEKRYVEMVKCFERHSRGARRIELTLRFEIGDSGEAHEVHADTEAKAVGRCFANLVARTKFPTDKATQVVYPIAFWRT